MCEAGVRGDVFEGLKRRLGVDVVQPEGESSNAVAAEIVRDQRAKRWELTHVHGWFGKGREGGNLA